MHRSLWELRKEKRWLSEKAKLLENLPRERQKGIPSLYLKAISKCPSALRHPSLLQHTHTPDPPRGESKSSKDLQNANYNEPPQEEIPHLLTTFACPTHRERKSTSPQLPPRLQEPPSLGNQPSCQPWLPASASHLAVAIKKMLPFHFHPMQSSKNGRGSKSEFKLLFTGVNIFTR